MANKYSKDIRKKALAFMARGSTRKETAKKFGVSVATLYLWARDSKTQPSHQRKETKRDKKRAGGKLPVVENKMDALPALNSSFRESLKVACDWLKRLWKS